ncbi:MAG TPA: hypothetical protein VEA38_10535 [Terriglobales bacterium]|nr:hypothetical protein [Terriglobales bacterium]
MADSGAPELRMDPASLYREDTYTDRRIGTIRILTPVTRDGGTDLGRPVLYVGETQLLTTGGLLPLVFEIEATSLGDAADKFAEGAEMAIERTRREIEQMRREQASQIIVPDSMPGGGLRGPGLGGPGIGGPGGGLIRPR